MALHIKDVKTDHLVRYLARSRGIGITEAVRQAVEETTAADKAATKAPVEALKRRLQPLLDEMAVYKLAEEPSDKHFYDEMWEEEGL